MSLPKDEATRKAIKVFDGFVKYFPDAIAAVAQLSVLANEKHNPGEPLHWAKDKSTEPRNSQMRHMLDEASGGPLARDDEFGALHAVENAWRAMAQVQTLADQGYDVFAVEPDYRNILRDFMLGDFADDAKEPEQHVWTQDQRLPVYGSDGEVSVVEPPPPQKSSPEWKYYPYSYIPVGKVAVPVSHTPAELLFEPLSVPEERELDWIAKQNKSLSEFDPYGCTCELCRKRRENGNAA